MFGRKKERQSTKRSDSYEKYEELLKYKKIPIVILDPKWHELFENHQKTPEIKHLEKELNTLLKKRGQTTNDIKEYEKAKKVVMENIVNNMTDGHETDSEMRSKKQDANQKLMEELNQKLTDAENLQEVLPEQIEKVNRRLLIEGMLLCYGELEDNSDEIEQVSENIRQIREELRKQILLQQDLEMRNTKTYKYMHKMFGADVLNVFDVRHKVWKGNLEESAGVDEE